MVEVRCKLRAGFSLSASGVTPSLDWYLPQFGLITDTEMMSEAESVMLISVLEVSVSYIKYWLSYGKQRSKVGVYLSKQARSFS